MKNVNWFKILLYLSLAFLAVSLYRADYLKIPEIHSFFFLGVSIVLLFSGILVLNLNWKNILERSFDLKISYKDSVISNGLSIFTKYIPGKVLVIMGRALYISEKYNRPLKQTTVASLQTQIFTLWIGFMYALILLFFIKINVVYIVLMVSFLLSFSLFLFWRKFNAFLSSLIHKVFKKQITFPFIQPKNIAILLPSFVLNWGLWSLGFYFFAQALSSNEISLLVGLCFPLAATFAIVAIVSPGGLGVREGILAFSIISLGLDSEDAITISTASRLWFLVGEGFFFIMALILNKGNGTKTA